MHEINVYALPPQKGPTTRAVADSANDFRVTISAIPAPCKDLLMHITMAAAAI
jgi:hypothetical protein